MKLNKSNKGFTIIEVLIVLAIAASIILVVFLAVPALQRNSRNNSYRLEAQRYLGATQEYISNNGGANLKSTDEGVSTTANSTAEKIQKLANSKNIVNLTIQNNSTTNNTGVATDSAILRYTSKCNGQSATQTGTGRQIALLFAVEDSTGAALTQCIDS